MGKYVAIDCDRWQWMAMDGKRYYLKVVTLFNVLFMEEDFAGIQRIIIDNLY